VRSKKRRIVWIEKLYCLTANTVPHSVARIIKVIGFTARDRDDGRIPKLPGIIVLHTLIKLLN